MRDKLWNKPSLNIKATKKRLKKKLVSLVKASLKSRIKVLGFPD